MPFLQVVVDIIFVRSQDLPIASDEASRLKSDQDFC